jgi:glyoxylase-like metal-dependent hydrolase (beta-lactamase superfamily II)
MVTDPMELCAKSLDVPEKTVPMGGKGRIEIVHLGGTTPGDMSKLP